MSPRLDHYVSFISRMCVIMHNLGVKTNKIEELKNVAATKIECELNERAISPPRDKSRYPQEVIAFLYRLEMFARNFAALRQYDHPRYVSPTL